MNKKQIVVLLLIGAALTGWFYFDLGAYLQLDVAQERLGEWQAWKDANPALAGLAFFAIYVVVTGLSLPGAAISEATSPAEPAPITTRLVSNCFGRL